MAIVRLLGPVGRVIGKKDGAHTPLAEMTPARVRAVNTTSEPDRMVVSTSDRTLVDAVLLEVRATVECLSLNGGNSLVSRRDTTERYIPKLYS
jgi:hypothetical protein